MCIRDSNMLNGLITTSENIVVRSISKENLLVKRVMDIVICIVLLPIAIPLMVIGTIAIYLTSKGPAIFTQKRVGLDGRIFTIYKIRTMTHCSTGYIDHTVVNDCRITKIGSILRKTKIDELPQLFNVLIGDMSIIGPRPERAEIVEKFTKESNHYQYRHIIRPGITGWAQVNNPVATPEENLQKLEYDLYYINNYSLKLEVQILMRTVGVVSSLQSL